MALVTVSDTTLTDIADAIRAKNGTSNTYKPSEMPDAIDSISGGGITPTGTIEITENGTYDVSTYSEANVNVPQEVVPTETKIKIFGYVTSDYKRSNTSLSDGIFTMSGNTSWTSYVWPKPVIMTYSEFVGKTISVSLDYTITDLSTGKLIVVPALFSDQNAGTRTNYSDDGNPLESFYTITENGSGTLTFEFVVSTEVFNNTTVNVSNYIGLTIYLYANTEARAALSNIKMEVVL